MLRQLVNNKKAQNTAEYALLIALVIAAIIAMQLYAQRALQARVGDAAKFMTAQTAVLGTTNQYEPYYKQEAYNINSDRTSNTQLGEGTTASASTSNRERVGNETSTYDTAIGVGTGI